MQRNTYAKIVVVSLVIASIAIPVMAQSTEFVLSNGEYRDGFEDGNIDEYDTFEPEDMEVRINDTQTFNGAYSIEFMHGEIEGSYAETNGTFTLDTNSSFEFNTYMLMSDYFQTNGRGGGGNADGCMGLFGYRISDGQKDVFIGLQTDDNQFNNPSHSFRAQGSMIDNAVAANADFLEDGNSGTTYGWIHFNGSFNYDTNNATFYFNDTSNVNQGKKLGTVSINGTWENPDNVKVRFVHDPSSCQQSDSIKIWYDAADVLGAGRFIEESIDVSVSLWQAFDSTQSYSVQYTETNTTSGEILTSKDVTDETNVTSDNTTILSPNENQNVLVSFSESGLVPVTFEYEGISEQLSIFVGSRTLENIENMPPEQYATSFFGYDEEQAFAGIGGEIQWIYLAILVGSMASWIARNEYLGIGLIVFLIILFWAYGTVSLGITLVAVFYGIFIGYMQMDIPSRSDTNIGGGLR